MTAKKIELTPRQEAIVNQLLSLRKHPLECGQIACRAMRDLLRSLPVNDLAAVLVAVGQHECSARATKRTSR